MRDYLHEIDDATTDANAAIRELANSLGVEGTDATWDVICECEDDRCLERVPLSTTDYDSL
jgi:hypothetical protein